MEYRFIKIKDLIKAIENGESEVGFTFDTIEDATSYGIDDFEPTGWYGIKKVKLFDFDQWVIGYYGGGIECVLFDYEYESPTEFFINFYAQEFGGVITEDTLVCVEPLQFENDKEFQVEISKTKFNALDEQSKQNILMETAIFFTQLWACMYDGSFEVDSITKAEVISDWTREFELSNYGSQEYFDDVIALTEDWFKNKFNNVKEVFEQIYG